MCVIVLKSIHPIESSTGSFDAWDRVAFQGKHTKLQRSCQPICRETSLLLQNPRIRLYRFCYFLFFDRLPHTAIDYCDTSMALACIYVMLYQTHFDRRSLQSAYTRNARTLSNAWQRFDCVHRERDRYLSFFVFVRPVSFCCGREWPRGRTYIVTCTMYRYKTTLHMNANRLFHQGRDRPRVYRVCNFRDARLWQRLAPSCVNQGTGILTWSIQESFSLYPILTKYPIRQRATFFYTFFFSHCDARRQ